MRPPPPLEAARRTLAGELDAHEMENWPTSYFRMGDVLLLDLPVPKPEARVAEALARRLGMRSVVGVEGRIEGEFRTPRVRLLWGDPDTETVHVENGVRYRTDPMRLMWSQGNLAERQRVARWDCRGETVVDLFSGVGYFALPVAAHTGVERVIAIEKNPLAFRYLTENVALNGLEGRMEAVPGDCREVAPRQRADRVLLGLLPDSMDFIDTALECLRPAGGMLHVHRVVGARGMPPSGASEIVERIERRGRAASIANIQRVKSYSPGHDHVIFEVRVGPASGG